jgi:hypothetical protein
MQVASTTGHDQAENESVPVAAELPGTPTLTAGARIIADGDFDAPLPARPAVPGMDFASNRLIVVFEATPLPGALGPYLSAAGNADQVTPVDNAALVDHPFYRKVSHNLAGKYGLTEASRVFYKDVNFAVYELPGISHISQLDALMLRVLGDNPGLVREVSYDMFFRVDDPAVLPPPPARQAGAGLPAPYPPPRRSVGAGYSTAGLPGNADRQTSILPPDDPYCVNRGGDDNDDGRGSWGLWRIGSIADQAWDYTTGSTDVVVAVVDTGVRYTHEDLAANCINPAEDPPYNGPGILTDVVYKDNDPSDVYGHGTLCAGLIGAEANNAKGLAGVNWDVTILPIKVLSDTGYGTDSQVAQGLLLADYLGADIISLSLYGPFPGRATQLATIQCTKDDVLVVACAGNHNTSAPRYPAYYPECLCVGATTLVNAADTEDFSLADGELPVATRHDARATFSDYGSWVDIAAPGVRCLSTASTSDSAYSFDLAGTSLSAPYVAGCAALLWAYLPEPDSQQVRSLLQSSAVQMTHLNAAASPQGFIDDATNDPVRCANVYQAILLYESGPFTPPAVSWDNPADGAAVSGTTEIRLAVTPGGGSVTKVEFETDTRQLGLVTAPDSGFYRLSWDTAFEFNRPLGLRAVVYDDKGSIVRSGITVLPDNTHAAPAWSEDFTAIANDALPPGWTRLDGNQGSPNTAWGATDAIGSAAAPSLHSSGSIPAYAAYSNDYVFAPVIDLGSLAAAEVSFRRRFERNYGDYLYFVTTGDDRDFNYIRWDAAGLQDWTTVTRDLSAYVGGEVRMFWVLLANNSGGSAGLYIDDVAVTGLSGTGPTVTISLPADGSSVSGVVELQLELSDDTDAIELRAVPPLLDSLWFTSIPDNDEGPTKFFSILWDSRHTYNGGSLLTVLAYDDEDGDGDTDDFVASDFVSLSVENSLKLPTWIEEFEEIGTLGGISGTELDGDWYTRSTGASFWHITTAAASSGDHAAKFGPEGAGNYGNYARDWLFSPVLDLSSTLRPHLRIWHKLDVAADQADFGRLDLVRYVGLDETLLTLGEWRSDTTPGGSWVSQAFDLTAYSGDPLRFSFFFSSNGDGDAGTGWLLDDIELLDANPQVSLISNYSRGTPGSTRTISGVNFGMLQGASAVTFAKNGGSRTTATVNSWSDTALEVLVPTDAVSGDVVVTVLGYDSPGYYFRVDLEPPALVDLGQL